MRKDLIETFHKDYWLVGHVGPMRYIGRVELSDLIRTLRYISVDAVSDPIEVMVAKAVQRRIPVPLSPCLEYHLQVVQNDKGGIAKSPILLGYDLLTDGNTPVNLLLDTYMFISHCEKHDRDRYGQLVEQTLKMLYKAEEASRAQASGIVLADAGSPLPPMGKFRGR
jgi:hypothetical protein